MADVELLPLPSGNVAHPIAAQAAEVEALRAEVGALHMHAKRRDQYAVEKAAQALDWKERAERLAEALRVAREYVVSELAAERDKFAGYEHCSNIASIEADLAKIDAALSKENSNG